MDGPADASTADLSNVASSMPAALSVRGLSYRYPSGEADVLRSLSLELAPGERVAVLGPNGSGKTTFVLHLNGLIAAQQGSVAVAGVAVDAKHLGDIRRAVGLVFQDPDDQLFMQTVRDDVAFGPANLGLRGSERDACVDDALRAVGAAALADRNPHHLSGGERRRAAIATVLSMEPSLLVFDEPTSGLDPLGRQELANLLGTLTTTQLIVTHDLPFALAVCPRAVILDGGSIVADGSTRELLSDAQLLARHRLALPFGFELSPSTSNDPPT